MLTILPVDDEILYNSIMKKYKTNGKKQVILFAKECGEELGYIIADILDECINILDLKIINSGFINQTQLEDSLIKACISYGANRNIFEFESNTLNIFQILDLFGFKSKNNKKVFNSIEQLKTCKNC